MLTCHDANVLIVRTIDDALSGTARAALRRHLASCARCRAEYDTQHEVRRLLVLHIQDRLPEGFDDRLNARLALASRPPARRWGLRLIPLAATLALIVAEPPARDISTRQSVSADVPSSPLEPRAFTTVVLSRSDRASRRHRPSPVAPVPADDVATAPAAPANIGEWRAAEAVAESATDSTASDRVSAPEPRVQEPERERVARREREPGGRRALDERAPDERAPDERAGDERAGDERVEAERAPSQRPGILPRPATPKKFWR